jgi:hypothetical protein
MNKKILIGVLAAFVVLVYLALTHKNVAPRKDEVAQSTQQAPVETTVDDTEPVAAVNAGDTSLRPEAEIQFTKSLVVTRKTISMDGGPAKEIPCISEDSEAPNFFGFMNLTDGTRVDFSCLSGDDGTVDLRYTSVGGETLIYTIASAATSDENETWDLRSWLTKDAQNGQITIRSITLMSSETEPGADNAACTMNEKLAMWNDEVKDFTEAMPTGETFDLSLFTSPINVNTLCLNTDGSWKKK